MGRTAAWLLVPVVVLAGCAGPDAAGPEAGEPGVPSIGDARDVRGATACALLDDTARSTLGFGAGAADTAPEGPRCRWRGPAAALELTLFAGDGGLATLAANSEPTTTRVRVAGYPALETFTAGGTFCQYDVGVAAEQVVLAALDGGTPDACTALQQLLPGVLAALPPLSS